MQLEFEVGYYKFAVQHIISYTIGTPFFSFFFFEGLKKLEKQCTKYVKLQDEYEGNYICMFHGSRSFLSFSGWEHFSPPLYMRSYGTQINIVQLLQTKENIGPLMKHCKLLISKNLWCSFDLYIFVYIILFCFLLLSCRKSNQLIFFSPKIRDWIHNWKSVLHQKFAHI